MSTAELTPVEQPLEVVPMPDLSTLPLIDFAAMLTLHASDEVSLLQIQANAREAKSFIERVKDRVKKVKAYHHAMWRFCCDTENVWCEEPAQVEKHAKDETTIYRERIEQAKAAQEAAGRAAAEAKYQSELEDWTPLDPEPEMEVVSFAAPVIPGKQRYLPWSYEVTNLRQAVTSILEKNDDALLADLVQICDKKMTGEARRLKASLSAEYPGVRGIRKKIEVNG